MRDVARMPAAIALLVLTAALVAMGPGERGRSGPEIELTRASSELRIFNSRAGHAVVKGGNIEPGDLRVGRITVTASRPAQILLAAEGIKTKPGPEGGVLTQALRMRVKRKDVDGDTYTMLYDGPVTGLGAFPLGLWQPGHPQRVLVSIRFLATPGSQDSLQGASTGFRLVWNAVGVAPPR